MGGTRKRSQTNVSRLCQYNFIIRTIRALRQSFTVEIKVGGWHSGSASALQPTNCVPPGARTSLARLRKVGGSNPPLSIRFCFCQRRRQTKTFAALKSPPGSSFVLRRTAETSLSFDLTFRNNNCHSTPQNIR